MYLITIARQALEPLWKKAYLRGSCWGPKEGNNPYGGTNLVIAEGKELVAVSQYGDTLVIREFKRTEGTGLGKKVKAILLTIKEQPLVMKDGEVIPMRDYICCCFACKKRFGVDRADDNRITINKIMDVHRQASPKCRPTFSQFKVYNDQFVEQTDLMKILALELVK